MAPKLTIPEPLQRLMGRMLRDMQQAGLERAESAAKADPRAHRLSRVFPKGARMNWRYYRAGRDGRGSEVRFCYTVERNVAGYFLAYRETRYKSGNGKRDQWAASKSKKAVMAICTRRLAAFRQRSK